MAYEGNALLQKRSEDLASQLERKEEELIATRESNVENFKRAEESTSQLAQVTNHAHELEKDAEDDERELKAAQQEVTILRQQLSAESGRIDMVYQSRLSAAETLVGELRTIAKGANQDLWRAHRTLDAIDGLLVGKAPMTEAAQAKAAHYANYFKIEHDKIEELLKRVP